MSPLITPYYDFVVECPSCNQECNVRIWNGVKNFDMVPDLKSYMQPNIVLSVIMCEFDFCAEAMETVVHSGPHGTDLFVLWAEDQRTYDLLCKFAINPQAFLMEHPHGEDDDDEGHRTH